MWGNTAYCVKLSGEDLSRCSDKTESVGLRKCPYYRNLTKKVMSRYFAELAPYHGGKSSWYGYGMKKLRRSHSMYTATSPSRHDMIANSTPV